MSKNKLLVSCCGFFMASCMAVVFTETADAVDRPSIDDVSVEGGVTTGLEFHFNMSGASPSEPKFLTLSNPNRLVMDLEGVGLMTHFAPKNLASPPFQMLTFGDDGHRSRVVFKLDQKVNYTVKSDDHGLIVAFEPVQVDDISHAKDTTMVTSGDMSQASLLPDTGIENPSLVKPKNKKETSMPPIPESMTIPFKTAPIDVPVERREPAGDVSGATYGKGNVITIPAESSAKSAASQPAVPVVTKGKSYNSPQVTKYSGLNNDLSDAADAAPTLTMQNLNFEKQSDGSIDVVMLLSDSNAARPVVTKIGGGLDVFIPSASANSSVFKNYNVADLNTQVRSIVASPRQKRYRCKYCNGIR